MSCHDSCHDQHFHSTQYPSSLDNGYSNNVTIVSVLGPALLSRRLHASQLRADIPIFLVWTS
jgi:hypothetical protein